MVVEGRGEGPSLGYERINLGHRGTEPEEGQTSQWHFYKPEARQAGKRVFR